MFLWEPEKSTKPIARLTGTPLPINSPCRSYCI
jgi:hypothetical protein